MSARIDEIPKGLFWHYANWNGLNGIVKTQTLWASHYKYLNDEQELLYGFQQLERKAQVMEYLPAHMQGAFSAASRLATATDAVKACWVTSLSEATDELSQWAMYAGGTGGFAIGFTKETLETIASEFRGEFVQCQYQSSDQLRIIEPIAQRLRNLLSSTNSGMKSQDDAASLMAARAGTLGLPQHFTDLYKLAPQIKHPAFHAEKEWRIVSFGDHLGYEPKTDWAPDKSFHSRPTMLTPHVEIPLYPKSLRTYPIAAILVGPGHHKALNADAVERMLALKARMVGSDEIGKIPVAESAIPYRAW